MPINLRHSHQKKKTEKSRSPLNSKRKVALGFVNLRGEDIKKTSDFATTDLCFFKDETIPESLDALITTQAFFKMENGAYEPVIPEELRDKPPDGIKNYLRDKLKINIKNPAFLWFLTHKLDHNLLQIGHQSFKQSLENKNITPHFKQTIFFEIKDSTFFVKIATDVVAIDYEEIRNKGSHHEERCEIVSYKTGKPLATFDTIYSFSFDAQKNQIALIPETHSKTLFDNKLLEFSPEFIEIKKQEPSPTVTQKKSVNARAVPLSMEIFGDQTETSLKNLQKTPEISSTQVDHANSITHTKTNSDADVSPEIAAFVANITSATDKALKRTQSLTATGFPVIEKPGVSSTKHSLRFSQKPTPIRVQTASNNLATAQLLETWGKKGRETHDKIFNLQFSEDNPLETIEDFEAYISVINVTVIKNNAGFQPLAKLDDINAMKQLIQNYHNEENAIEKAKIKDKIIDKKQNLDSQISTKLVEFNLDAQIVDKLNRIFLYPKNGNFFHLGHEVFRAKLNEQDKSINIQENMITLSPQAANSVAIRVTSEGFNVTDHSRVRQVKNTSKKEFFLLPPKIITSKKPIVTFDTQFAITGDATGTALKLESTTEIIRNAKLVNLMTKFKNTNKDNIKSEALWNRITDFFRNISFFGRTTHKRNFKKAEYLEPTFITPNARPNAKYFKKTAIHDFHIVEQTKPGIPRSRPIFSSIFFRLKPEKARVTEPTDQPTSIISLK